MSHSRRSQFQEVQGLAVATLRRVFQKNRVVATIVAAPAHLDAPTVDVTVSGYRWRVRTDGVISAFPDHAPIPLQRQVTALVAEVG